MNLIGKIMELNPGMAENELLNNHCPSSFNLGEYEFEECKCGDDPEECLNCWHQEYEG